ncbi:hypothetical protein EV182_007991, partial [Spiromyces aspiralis]
HTLALEVIFDRVDENEAYKLIVQQDQGQQASSVSVASVLELQQQSSSLLSEFVSNRIASGKLDRAIAACMRGGYSELATRLVAIYYSSKPGRVLFEHAERTGIDIRAFLDGIDPANEGQQEALQARVKEAILSWCGNTGDGSDNKLLK